MTNIAAYLLCPVAHKSHKKETLTWDGEQCGSCWWQQHGYHNWNGTWAGPQSPPQGDLHTRHTIAGFSEMLCAAHDRIFCLNCSVHTVHTWFQNKSCDLWKWSLNSKTCFHCVIHTSTYMNQNITQPQHQHTTTFSNTVELGYNDIG